VEKILNGMARAFTQFGELFLDPLDADFAARPFFRKSRLQALEYRVLLHL